MPSDGLNIVTLTEFVSGPRRKDGHTGSGGGVQTELRFRFAHVVLAFTMVGVVAFSHLHTGPWGTWTIGWRVLWFLFLPTAWLLGPYFNDRVPFSFVGAILVVIVAAPLAPLAVPPALALLALFLAPLVPIMVFK